MTALIKQTNPNCLLFHQLKILKSFSLTKKVAYLLVMGNTVLSGGEIIFCLNS